MTQANNPSPTSTPPTPPHSKTTPGATPTGNPALQVQLDQENQLIIYGTRHQLTPQQEKCLVALALQPQKVITQAAIYLAIWGHDVVEPAAITHIITSLRKLGLPIVTLERRGYMLQMPPDQVQILGSPHQ